MSFMTGSLCFTPAELLGTSCCQSVDAGPSRLWAALVYDTGANITTQAKRDQWMQHVASLGMQLLAAQSQAGKRVYAACRI